MAEAPLLVLRGLTRCFGGVRAVDGLDLEVPAGRISAIIGPNGAGKTTVFNLITGIYRPDRGSILLEGQPLQGRAPHAIARLGVARTFQNIRLFGRLSVLDNVRAALARHAGYGWIESLTHLGRFGRGERALTDRAQETLAWFGLDDAAHLPAASLPYGRQRRLEIARALATGPRLLLLDEPAAGLNPSEVKELTGFLDRIQSRFDLTILLIEHQMHLVMQLCRHIAVMDFGQLLARGGPAEIQSDPAVIQAYLGALHPGAGPGD